jgi:hypothetical protein
MKLFKLSFLIFAISLPSVVNAKSQVNSKSTSVYETSESNLYPFQPYAKGGANLISTPEASFGTNKVQWLLGAGTNYYIDPKWGLFANVEFNQRGRKFLNTTLSSASYIDIPFGVAHEYGDGLWSSASFSTLHAGPYVALPLSDFKYDYPYSAARSVPYKNFYQETPTAKTYGGIYIDNDIMFRTNSSFAPGITTWIKLPLGSAVTGTNTKFYEFGIGFKVGLF